MKWFRSKWLVALAAAMALALTACSGAGSTGSAPGSVAGVGASGKNLKILFVGNFPSSDPFGSIVIKGYEAGLATYGVSGEYRAPSAVTYVAADQVRLVEAAIAQKPDGLIVTDPAPDGLNTAIKKAVDAGIPVVLTNQGADQVDAVGALGYVGNDESGAGEVGGAALQETGAKKAVLLTLQPGVPVVDKRNEGFERGFKGEITTVAIPLADAANTAKIKATLDAALLKDESIDSVFTTGAIFNAPLIAERATLGARGESMHWASIDLGDPVVTALQDKKMDFAVDQQPYLQGFLPVQIISLYLRFGLTPAQKVTPTGPSLITPSNVGTYATYAKEGVR